MTAISGTHPDSEQLAIIEAHPSSRLLVDAGPGTGKTHVACARVAQLLRLGVRPSRIWLVSFTRTAVKEIRDRILELSDGDARARAVKISTIDSQSWHLVNGFDGSDSEKLFGGDYDMTIRTLLSMIEEENDDLLDYLDRMQHLIVDEAQDLTGVRARLIVSLLNALPESAGYTVFADPAQAIYGFTEFSDQSPGEFPVNFLELVVDLPGLKKISLTHNYRIRSTSLRELFKRAREDVFAEDLEPEERRTRIEQTVRERADSEIPAINQQHLSEDSDVLVLYRYRWEVLQASSYLSGLGVLHRLRLSGMPVCVHPWIALLFWDFEVERIDKDSFFSRWRERISSLPEDSVERFTPWPSAELAWGQLRSVAPGGEDEVNLGTLRDRLSRSQPPIELTAPDLNWRGPIVGTIHASKGREAAEVRLMLPRMTAISNRSDPDEEARVIYVGSTRPKEGLGIGDGFPGKASYIDESARRYRHRKHWKRGAQVEVGRNVDISAHAQVSRRLFSSEEDAILSQQSLAKLSRSIPIKLRASANPESGWVYRIFLDSGGDLPIGSFSRSFNSDLWAIAEKLGKKLRTSLRPPTNFYNFYLVGTRTGVIKNDDPTIDEMHEPFRSTGFFLVPVVCGFPKISFKLWRGGRSG